MNIIMVLAILQSAVLPFISASNYPTPMPSSAATPSLARLPSENHPSIQFEARGMSRFQPRPYNPYKSHISPNPRPVDKSASAQNRRFLHQSGDQIAKLIDNQGHGGHSKTSTQNKKNKVNDRRPKVLNSQAQNQYSAAVASAGVVTATSATKVAAKSATTVQPLERTVALTSIPAGESAQDYVKSTLTELDTELIAAFEKARKIVVCKKAILKARYQVEKAQAIIVNDDWYRARRKVNFAKELIEVCLLAIEGQNQTTDRGSSELTASHDLCSTIIDALTVLAYQQDSLKPVISDLLGAVSEGTDPINVAVNRNSYGLTATRETGGARLRSNDNYTSGTFTVNLKCPTGTTTGSNTAFYLSTPLDGPSRNSILMEFYGDTSHRVAMNTVFNGANYYSSIADLGFNCSEEFHNYTIVWTPNKIMWYADKNLLRYHDNKGMEVFPANTTMSVYMSLLYASTVATGSWSTGSPDSPVSANFSNVQVGTPTIVPPVIPGSVKNALLFPISLDYCSQNMETGRGSASITYHNYGCGGRWHSTVPYQYGKFSTSFKCAAGNTSGLVSSFYASSGEGTPTQDEIDFEWLGHDKTGVQTNVYVAGSGGREVWIPFDFDCSEDFHTYDIIYSAKKIMWRVDGKIVRTMLAADSAAYPSQAVLVYGSIWDASFVLDGYWTGKWNGGADAPWTVQYKNITIQTPI